MFTVGTPNKGWVTDITYIRTWQGWLYLAVVLDLYARKVVGWSMKPTLGKELALDALLTEVWRRKPKTRVIVHSDQRSHDWKRFCLANHKGSTKPETWPEQMCSITLKCFTTERVVTVT